MREPLKPSRRVFIVAVVAIICSSLIVGVALVGLETPEAAVSELDARVLPGVAAVNATSTQLIRGQARFQTALTSTAEERGPLIADAQQAGSDASAAWQKYQRLAFGSRAELRAQRRYERLVRDGQTAGADVFGLINVPESPEYTAALARVRDISVRQLEALEEIKRRFLEPHLRMNLESAQNGISDTRLALLITFIVVLVAAVVNAIVLLGGAHRQERVSEVRDRERLEVKRRSDLENELQRGLEMEPTEDDTFGVIASALALVRPGAPTEVLVAESSRAHFRQVLTTDRVGGGPGCAVPSPLECPAASSGQVRLFLSGTRLDACPFLRGRDDNERSAACVPVSIAGTTTGVIHTTGAAGVLPSASEMADVELVARKAGDRIGFLRVLARTETQARIDGLTGLLNRRTIERQAREVLQQGSELIVAYADLDYFKVLNDKHGHDAGDRARRLFGRVLRDSVRPTDVPGRYGGEEFIVLLPDCTLADAEIVVSRIRQQLASAIEVATAPEFTVSIGLAAWMPPETFNETVARADAALLEAKATGKDRVVVSHQLPRLDRIPRAPQASEQASGPAS